LEGLRSALYGRVHDAIIIAPYAPASPAWAAPAFLEPKTAALRAPASFLTSNR
jgi:hypothetical protein